MILNENKFFHLNFYSSWCSFFSLSFRTNIAFNELFKRTKILIWKELFCPVVTYYICRPIRRFFYYRNLPAQSKLSRNLINNFFNYLRFFIWTGNFNRHYTSTLMARACESNDNKTKGFFFFFPVVYLQLSIVGELDGKPGYLAFGGIVMSHETYCSPQPSTAQKGIRLTIN